ncbi:MAG: carbon storage regulator [Planctomycetia bacterium]|nr:carbon storage regulator [Planctomycetia bacterium]
MLVLSRKVGEKILIGDNITITVVRVAQGTVRIGVDAPRSMPVIREEVIVPDVSVVQEKSVHDSSDSEISF